MERGFVGLDIAVLAVGDALAIADEPPAQLVVDRVQHAGHRVVAQAVCTDNVQQVKAKYLEWIADSQIDVVIVTSGARTEAASEALAPLATKSLLGFADLFRHLTFSEIGSAAMLVDAAAAQCKSTFVFVLPASIGAVRTALEKLLLPQLDYRTKPHNLVMRMPRHHVGSPSDPVLDQSAPVKTPWITAKPGGTTLPPSLPRAPGIKRAATEPGAPAPSQSVSQRIELAAVQPRDQMSVSQRMNAVLDSAAASARSRPPTNQPLPSPSSIPIPSGLPADGGAGFQAKEPTAQGVAPARPSRPPTAPPTLAVAVPATIRPPTNPPATRSKTPTSVAVVPLKPPANAIPLSTLLTNSSSPVIAPAPEPAAPPKRRSAVMAAIEAVEPVMDEGLASPAPSTSNVNGAGHEHPLGGVALDSLERAAHASGPIRVTADRVASEREDLSDEETRAAAAERAAMARTTAAINAALDDAEDRVAAAEGLDDETDSVEDLPPSSPAIKIPDFEDIPPGVAAAIQRPSAPAIPPTARRHTGTIPAAVPPPTPSPTSKAIAVTDGDKVAAAAREAIAAQKRAATQRVTAVAADFDDDLDAEPRRVAIPSRRRQRRQLMIVWSVIALAAVALIALVVVYVKRQDARANIGYAQPATTPTQPVVPPPPEEAVPIDAAPAIVEPPPAPVEPTEIDMPVDPDPPRPTERPATTPTTRPATTPTTRPATTPTTRPTGTPTTKPAPTTTESPAPATEPGCDEVSCVLEGYKLACCARYKPKGANAEASSTSSLSKKQVQAGVAAIKPVIIKCGEQHPAKGTVKVSVTVQPSGAVKTAVVTESPDPGLAACVTEAMRKAQFDATDEGGSFKYPFVF